MALVSRRRFPVDAGLVRESMAMSAMPLSRNATIGHFGQLYNIKKSNTKVINDGLLTIRYRNSNFQDDDLRPDGFKEDEIGCGGYGVVWVVRDPRTVGRRVAIKKMADVFRSLGHCKRAYRELRMLCWLKHENILTCSDILEPTEPFDDVFVVTELMETDLQRIIVSSQPLRSDHIKMFMYQLLRGMKYLHSANILHRDLKPSNLLVNSNCFLKICDFGLARIWDEENDEGVLTPEVVTEYYRSPELLMGALRYNTAADVWSIGCIFAELLGRRILFQTTGPLEQLELIMDLLGTPTWSQMKYACDTAKSHVLRSLYRPSNIAKLYSLGAFATSDAVDLLIDLLKFDPDERMRVEDALEHAYVQDARLLYHSCMCSCCGNADRARLQIQQMVHGSLRHRLEPMHTQQLDGSWERELDKLGVKEIRRRIYDFIMLRLPIHAPMLALNKKSPSYNRFMASTVIPQPNAIEDVDVCWD